MLFRISFLLGLATLASIASEAFKAERLLYVAVPGIRNYLEYGGHGILVFEIDNNHRFRKRIPTAGLGDDGKPLNVKGVCANAATTRIYVSTLKTLTAVDLATEKVVWEKPYRGGCDRMAISPDGKTIYLPSLEKEHWHVVDALSGEVISTIVTHSGAHNTLYSADGSRVFLAGLKSPILRVADASSHQVAQEVGPFGHFVRPFTVNAAASLCFVNVNELLGFEVGDLKTGKALHRVEVAGYKKGPIKRHGCPSHGIGLTPDEKEIWLCDAANQSLHIFDATVMPPKQLTSIKLADEPGWVTFTIKGDYAYPSTGQVIDPRTRKILTQLKDETGTAVQSEKMVEIDFHENRPVRTGDQFGIGRKASKAS